MPGFLADLVFVVVSNCWYKPTFGLSPWTERTENRNTRWMSSTTGTTRVADPASATSQRVWRCLRGGLRGKSVELRRSAVEQLDASHSPKLEVSNFPLFNLALCTAVRDAHRQPQTGENRAEQVLISTVMAMSSCRPADQNLSAGVPSRVGRAQSCVMSALCFELRSHSAFYGRFLVPQEPQKFINHARGRVVPLLLCSAARQALWVADVLISRLQSTVVQLHAALVCCVARLHWCPLD